MWPIRAWGGIKMGFIWTIIIGLIIGVIAKLLMPGRDPQGCIITILIGIGGSVVARVIGHALGWYRAGQPAGFIASILGAMLLLFIYHRLTRKAGPPPEP